MRNLTCGDGFFLFNYEEDQIQGWQIAENSYIEGTEEISDQKHDILISRISNTENLFLAFNHTRQSFKTFVSNGKDRLMDNVTVIRFGSNEEPDLIGLHAFSKPIFFGLHPKWNFDPDNHYIFTVDFT